MRLLLTVAHLITAKGIDVALKAVATLPPQVQLWVIGSGVEADNLQALADTLHLGDRVHLAGQIDPAVFAIQVVVLLEEIVRLARIAYRLMHFGLLVLVRYLPRPLDQLIDADRRIDGAIREGPISDTGLRIDVADADP